LRKLGPESRLQRAAGLDLYARVLIALGETERARNAYDQLQGVVDEVGSDSLRASALAVEGIVAEAEGDHDTARSRIEDAIDLFHQCGDRFEAARSRIDLARVLAALGRSDPAVEQARVAYEALAGMQATGEARRASALLSELGDPASVEATSVLTVRELDVLKLVARGLSNTEIAERLVLSEHTVHRHLANILRKLDLSSRTAAAAWGTRAGLI
jgi:DNA-binding CsgD family transcriptional regulator